MNKVTIELTKAKLAGLITDCIAGLHEDPPVERGGVTWMPADQEVLARHLGVSVKTLYRWTAELPFQREAAAVYGHGKVSLFRVVVAGEKPVRTPQHVANIMRNIWAEKVGTPITPHQHGCLIGLAKTWPEGSQLDIFKHVLNHWSDYMGTVKHFMRLIAEASETPLTTAKDNTTFYNRYFRYPTITVMLRFQGEAVASYAMKLQEDGKPVPPAVNAIYQAMPL